MTVLITYPHANTVSHSFMYSLMKTVMTYGDMIVDVRGMRCYPGDDLAQGRNRLMVSLLNSDADYVWTLDTDIGFGTGVLSSMLKHRLPIVSGLYNTVIENGNDGRGGYHWTSRPTVYDESKREYPEYSGLMTGVGYVGAGCLLIAREVIVAVEEKFGPNWFSIIPGKGEDFSFCERVRECGYGIAVDCDLGLRHHKGVWV